MKITVFGDRVILLEISTEKVQNGIIIQKSVKEERISYFVVQEVGDNITAVKKGDKVRADIASCVPLTINGTKYHSCSMASIFLKYE